MSGFDLLGGGGVKSGQSGTFLTDNLLTNEVLIDIVDPNKSIVLINCYPESASLEEVRPYMITATLESNKITLKRNSGGAAVIVNWKVVEFSGAKKVQRGELVSVTGNVFGTNITVESVKVDKSILLADSQGSGGSTTQMPLLACRITNSESLYFRRNGSGPVSWQLIEFN